MIILVIVDPLNLATPQNTITRYRQTIDTRHNTRSRQEYNVIDIQVVPHLCQTACDIMNVKKNLRGIKIQLGRVGVGT